MKVYIGKDSNLATDYYDNFCQDIGRLEQTVCSSEATEIMCYRFLSGFEYKDAFRVLDLLIKKMRLNSTLTIVDLDFYLISKDIFREEVSIEKINENISSNHNIKSLLTLETIEQVIPTDKIQITEKHFDTDAHQFIIKLKKVS